MAIPKQLLVAGGVSIGPIQPSAATFPSGERTQSLNLSQTVQADANKTQSLNSPAAWVDLLAGTGITNLSFYSLRVRNGSSFELRFTTGGGADQILRVSELSVYSSPTSGQMITALAARGVGDFELELAGT